MTLPDLVARSLGNRELALRELERLDCEERLIDFIRGAWNALEPGTKFVDGWALGAICEHLEAVSSGQIRRLLINVPPGCTKSMTVNVFWPAWEWGPRNMPHLRYISASYAADLSIRDNLRCRDVIDSEWYQERWGRRFHMKGDQNAKIRYENTSSGWRLASSVGSALTGHRGDRIIVDDPHSVDSAESEAERETTLRWFTETLPTRVNDLEKSAMVIIMQRLHELDVSGLILSKKLGYEHLMLPMEFEPDHPFLSRTSLQFSDPRKERGELLWPERFSRKAVEELKETYRAKGGTYAEAGQLQQRPTPRGGGMFQRKDFTIIDQCPTNVLRRARGWDLAATKDGFGAFTACVKMAKLSDRRVVIEDVRRGRWGPNEVRQLMRQVAESDGHQVVQDVPQDPGQAGKAQKSDLAALLEGYDARFSPETGSKEDRARPLAAQAEAGNLCVVRGPWNDAFIGEACSFPNGEFKDQVDAASRAYARIITKSGMLVGASPETIE